METNMRMLEQKTTDFIEVLSSKEPVPGGGGACAAVGAFGAALGLMVANLTTGKKRYAEHEERIQDILKDAAVVRDELVALADKDAAAFAPLAKAYGLPKDTEEQKAYKEKVMEECLFTASQAPMEIMEKIMVSMDYLEELAVIGSRIALSDVGVGIQFAKAALNGASLNVFINTRLMKKKEVAEQLNAKADAMLKEGNAKADAVYERVMKEMK